MTTGVQQTLSGLLCVLCSGVIDEDDRSTHSTEICIDCDDTHNAWCDVCQEYMYQEDNFSMSERRRLRAVGVRFAVFVTAHDSGESVCLDCASQCGVCGEYYQWEDSELECCESDRNSMYVNNYSYRPTFKYYSGEGSSLTTGWRAVPGVLYMGVEIEVMNLAGLSDAMYRHMNEDEKSFVYLKEDGSIGDNGAEIVTMPANLRAFETQFPFGALDEVRTLGARSFAYSSCGFHIHVARTAFSATHMWKFVKLQLNNPAMCQRIGQRDESSYATWYYDSSDMGAGLPAMVKGKDANRRRYLAINFQNHATVELRYFKGNILRQAIMKNLEFVDAMYEYTKQLSYRDVLSSGLTEEKFLAWVNEQDRYPNFKYYIEYLDSKENN